MAHRPGWPRRSLRGRTIARPTRSLRLLLLVRPHEHGLAEDVAMHRLLEIRLARFAEIAEHDVQRVQLVKVAVASDRWARAVETGAVPVVDAFACSGWQVRRRCP